MKYYNSRYIRISLIISGLNLLMFILLGTGVYYTVLQKHNFGSEVFSYVPILLLCICLGLIFYGMLHALKYKWFLVLLLGSCLLAWTNMYIAMMLEMNG